MKSPLASSLLFLSIGLTACSTALQAPLAAPTAGGAVPPPPAASAPPAAGSAPAASARPKAPAAGNGALPPAECLAVLDRLSAGVPREESGPVLRSKGLRITTPIRVPEGVVTERSVTSAVRVRVMINEQGRVVPGSVTVQQAAGDPKLPLAMSEAVPATLSFDVSAAASVPKQFAFTTVYAVCAFP